MTTYLVDISVITIAIIGRTKKSDREHKLQCGLICAKNANIFDFGRRSTKETGKQISLFWPSPVFQEEGPVESRL